MNGVLEWRFRQRKKTVYEIGSGPAVRGYYSAAQTRLPGTASLRG